MDVQRELGSRGKRGVDLQTTASRVAERVTQTEKSVPAIRVVVVNYKSETYLARCLAALVVQTFQDFEVVVVDNASSGAEITRLLPADPRFRAIQLATNVGFAAANNRGAENCQARWIATLNPDAFPEPDWLERLIEATQRHPAEMYGSTQIMADHLDLYDGTGDSLAGWGIAFRSNYSRPIAGPPPAGFCFAPCAAAALYDRRLFQAVGGFDERFFCYMEDVDLGFRIRLRGGRCWQVDGARVLHVGSGTTGRGSGFSFFHGFRNQVWMLLKCIPGPLLPVVLALHSLAVAYLVLLRAGGRREAILCALLAAARGAPAVWRERGAVQRSRVLSSWAILGMLTWNPQAFRRRTPKLWRDEPSARLTEILP